MQQCRAWRDAGLDVAVAVNVSGRDLLDVALPDEVDEALQRLGVPADRLELEITENTILTDPCGRDRCSPGLSALGVSLAIDDFGAGYSSLGYLKRLPVDVLKIDRSFVINMSTRRERRGDRPLDDRPRAQPRPAGRGRGCRGRGGDAHARRARLRHRPGLFPRATRAGRRALGRAARRLGRRLRRAAATCARAAGR